MTDPTDPTDPKDRASSSTTGADLAGAAWAAPDPAVPPGRLSQRELIARAESCDQIAHTGSPADQAAALRDLDATWDEAERRAHGHPPVSVPAQVAGYIGLVREDYDHALAAETAGWRRQLDAALEPVELDPQDFGENREIATAHDLDAERAHADPEWAWGRYADRELTVTERADRAQSLAHGAGVNVAGYDPDTDIYTDPTTGQVVRLGGDRPEVGDWGQAATIAERYGYVVFDPTVAGGFRPLSAGERDTLTGHAQSEQTADAASRRWNAAEHEAYLDSRPGDTAPYNPAAEYGDPDWREPASDDEAAARTAWLAAHTAPALGWRPRPPTEVEDSLRDAQERAVLSDRAHDSDPYAWAEYDRLRALDELAPLPVHDALDDLPRNERGEPDTTALPSRSRDEAAPADQAAPDSDREAGGPDRVQVRLEQARARLAARDTSTGGAHRAHAGVDVGIDEQQRREQLARWHDEDRSSARAEAGDTTDHGDAGAADGESSGWQR